MAKQTRILMICFLCHLTLSSHAASLDHQLTLFNFPNGDMSSSSVGSSFMGCSGMSVEKCLGEEMSQNGEFEMESESTRRMLYWRRYISYGALNRDRVPCSRRGASYYNCRPGGAANPYSRGCSAITRCRR